MKRRLLGIAAAAALAVMGAVFGKARIRMGDFSGNMYVLGKKADPKAVFVTNRTPGKMVKNSIFGFKR